MNVVYGEPSREMWEEAKGGKIMLGGCCVNDNYVEWGCPNCGSCYKNIHDDWNRNRPSIEYTRRPAVCKMCGGTILPVIYGIPTSKAMKEQEDGKIILGGD